MARSFEVAVGPDGRVVAQMPGRCVCCGAPAEAESALAFGRLVMRRRRQVPVSVRLAVPHCRACARATMSLFWVGLAPGLAGFLLVGGATFVAVALGAAAIGLDDSGRPQDAPSLVLGAFFGLLAGIGGALAFELLARLLLLPILGRSMLRAPLLMVQLLTDADYVAGLRGRLSERGDRLRLTFDHDAAAAEFADRNPGAAAG
jgi:hypothetical protein